MGHACVAFLPSGPPPARFISRPLVPADHAARFSIHAGLRLGAAVDADVRYPVAFSSCEPGRRVLAFEMGDRWQLERHLPSSPQSQASVAQAKRRWQSLR